jgi:hypothetical protein
MKVREDNNAAPAQKCTADTNGYKSVQPKTSLSQVRASWPKDYFSCAWIEE